MMASGIGWSSIQFVAMPAIGIRPMSRAQSAISQVNAMSVISEVECTSLPMRTPMAFPSRMIGPEIWTCDGQLVEIG